jgi:predicted membrane channel-forming protein YqfA (hemolysin III family)
VANPGRNRTPAETGFGPGRAETIRDFARRGAAPTFGVMDEVADSHPQLSPAGYTLAEEAVHAALHGLGAVGALGGLAVLLWLAAVELADPAAAVAAVVYGGSLVVCFAASRARRRTSPNWSTTARSTC